MLCCSLAICRGDKKFDICKGFWAVVKSLQTLYARDRCNQSAVPGANACHALTVTQQLHLITSIASDAESVHVPLQVLHLQHSTPAFRRCLLRKDDCVHGQSVVCTTDKHDSLAACHQLIHRRPDAANQQQFWRGEYGVNGKHRQCQIQENWHHVLPQQIQHAQLRHVLAMRHRKYRKKTTPLMQWRCVWGRCKCVEDLLWDVQTQSKDMGS